MESPDLTYIKPILDALNGEWNSTCIEQDKSKREGKLYPDLLWNLAEIANTAKNTWIKIRLQQEIVKQQQPITPMERQI